MNILFLFIALVSSKKLIYPFILDKNNEKPVKFNLYEYDECYITGLTTSMSFTKEEDDVTMNVYESLDCTGNFTSEPVDLKDQLTLNQYSESGSEGHYAFYNNGSCENRQDYIHTYVNRRVFFTNNTYYKYLVETEDDTDYLNLKVCKDEKCKEDDMTTEKSWKCHFCSLDETGRSIYTECSSSLEFVLMALVVLLFI